MEKQTLLLMRGIMDNQLRTADDRAIGRVADVEAEVSDDGALVLTDMIVGPEALAGRVSSRLRPLAGRLFGGRFDHRIPMDAVNDVGPTIRLRDTLPDSSLPRSDRWLREHVLRFIPGDDG